MGFERKAWMPFVLRAGQATSHSLLPLCEVHHFLPLAYNLLLSTIHVAHFYSRTPRTPPGATGRAPWRTPNLIPHLRHSLLPPPRLPQVQHLSLLVPRPPRPRHQPLFILLRRRQLLAQTRVATLLPRHRRAAPRRPSWKTWHGRRLRSTC